ncbi:MAG: PepSY domain-containing protein [Plesiomonas sp.]
MVIGLLSAQTGADPLPELELDDDVQDTALAATQAGLIQPYSKLLQQVEQDFNGRIIEVELDEDDGIWEYELKLLGATNNVVKVKYNATTLKILKIKGHDLDSVLRRGVELPPRHD